MMGPPWILKPMNGMRTQTNRGPKASPSTYTAQLENGVAVVLIFLHFLPEANGLLHLVGVDVFGPPPLHMVHPTGHRLIAVRVHLERSQ